LSRVGCFLAGGQMPSLSMWARKNSSLAESTAGQAPPLNGIWQTYRSTLILAARLGPRAETIR
jgi:hypothetical protein